MRPGLSSLSAGAIMSRNQHTALVTGASSGIRCEFARELARRSINLVLTAHRRNRLETLASEVRTNCNVEVHTIALDFSLPGSENYQVLGELHRAQFVW
jgi:short-subunit dehydrogenase